MERRFRKIPISEHIEDIERETNAMNQHVRDNARKEEHGKQKIITRSKQGPDDLGSMANIKQRTNVWTPPKPRIVYGAILVWFLTSIAFYWIITVSIWLTLRLFSV